MNDSEVPWLAIGVIGFLIWLLIMYFVIRGAVQSGTEKQTRYLRVLYRIRVLELLKSGYSASEMDRLSMERDEEFYKSLGITDPKRSDIWTEEQRMKKVK